MLRGLDTNILLRIFDKGDVEQSSLVNAILDEYGEESFFISNIVLCEFVWVLETGFKFDKRSIEIALEKILINSGFKFENKDLAIKALQFFQNNKADFSDYLLALVHQEHGCDYTLSFDKKAYKTIDLFRSPTH
jgi:predicted nucleic-acid-binding protein